MDEDFEEVQVVNEGSRARMKSTVQATYGRPKGRGAGDERMVGHFEGLAHDDGAPAQKSVDGWVLFVTGVHEEATPEDLKDHFSEAGNVINCWMNLDRQTGYVKGYALLEFKAREEAETAIADLDGSKFLGRELGVTWAFVKAPQSGGRRRR